MTLTVPYHLTVNKLNVFLLTAPRGIYAHKIHSEANYSQYWLSDKNMNVLLKVYDSACVHRGGGFLDVSSQYCDKKS